MVDLAKYKQMFITESLQHLTEMAQTISSLKRSSDNIELINTLFRSAHTVKGMAAALSYDNISGLCHVLEDLLSVFRKGDKKISTDIIDVILESVDLLEEMIVGIEDGSLKQPDSAELINKIKDLEKNDITNEKTSDFKGLTIHSPYSAQKEKDILELEKLTQQELDNLHDLEANIFRLQIKFSSISKDLSSNVISFINKIKEIGNIEKLFPAEDAIKYDKTISLKYPVNILFSTLEDKKGVECIINEISAVVNYKLERLKVLKSRRAEEAGKKFITNVESQTDRKNIPKYRKPAMVTVKTEILDNLVNRIGEMIIHNSKLENLNAKISSKGMKEGLMQMDNLIKGLHMQTMKLRLTPLSMIFDILPKVVRDVLRNSEKNVELKIRGKDIEADKAIIEELGESLVHIIRNCVDHGIETPEERVKADKDPQGIISLSATKESEMVVIKIEDNGRGIDLEKVKERAVAAGLINEKEYKNTEAKDIFMLICHPGLSTAREVTSVSGRGVGMDVVKSKIDSMGGTLLIESEKGKGSIFTIKLPVSIAIISSFIFKIESYLFAVPLNKIFFVKDIPLTEVGIDNENKKCFIHKDEETIFLYDLKSRMKLPSTGKPKDHTSVIVVEVNGKKTGLVVDEFIKRHDIVVKPIGRPLEGLKVFSGVTVLGDGKPILILDVERL